jgi:MFS family permease
LPTYDQIGLAAPVLLVILRFIQGFGVGGEWGGAVLMVVEHGPRGRRGLYASWVQAGVPAGLLLANWVFGLFSLLPEDVFLSWGWRVPFLLGIVLLGVGLLIRLRIFESPLFASLRERKQQAGVPFFEVLKRYPRNVMLSIGARMAENAGFYIFTVFVLAYAKTNLEMSQTAILQCVLIASVAQFVAIPLFGRLSDAVGRRPVYLGGALAMAAFSFPFFRMLDTASTFWAGGVAPLICMSLLQWADGESWGVALYLVALSAITVISVWLAAETHRARLGDADEPE